MLNITCIHLQYIKFWKGGMGGDVKGEKALVFDIFVDLSHYR